MAVETVSTCNNVTCGELDVAGAKQNTKRPQSGADRLRPFVLTTSSSHSGVALDDRNYLAQQVTAVTGLAAADAERRVNALIADSHTAINRARRNSVIVAFSVAAATLIGAAVAWAAAVADGRHRDGEPLPNWMASSNRFHRGRRAMPVP